jgi:hypothetical protein
VRRLYANLEERGQDADPEVRAISQGEEALRLMGKLYGPHASGSKKHHRDLTHNPIAEILEAFGWKVVDTSAVGPDVPGFPDMVIGQGGITDMVQAKTGDEPFTPAEAKFHAGWRGRPIVVLRSKEETIEWARRERHERRQQSAHVTQKQLGPCVHRG